MNPPGEILVHISAPSRVQDDATYRRQFEAYLGFEIEKRYEILTCGRHLQDLSQKEYLLQSELANTTRDGYEIQLQDSRRDSEPRSGGAAYPNNDLPRNIQFSTPDGILETPNIRKLSALERIKGATAIQIEHTPNNPPPKRNSKGGLFRDAILAHPELELPSNTESTTTDRILETPDLRKSLVLKRLEGATAIQIGRTPNDQRPITASSASSRSLEQTPLRQAQSGLWETPPSVVPNSQPSYISLKRTFADSFNDSYTDSISWMEPSPLDHQRSSPPEKRLREARLSPEGVQSGAINSPEPESSDLAIALAPAPPTVESPTATQATITPSSSTATTTLATTSSESQQHVPAIAPAPPLAIPSGTIPSYVPNRPFFTIPPPPLPSPPQYISPPPPRPSNTPFVTHLTSSLLIAPNALPLSENYVPLSTTRPIKPLDRGYWHIPIASFAPDVRASFWDFMMQFVQEGRAGWDAALVLEEGGSGPWGEIVGEEIGEGPVVKVFCWGEVVGHLWLILYVASQLRIRGVGATWRDYAGEVVVRME